MEEDEGDPSKYSDGEIAWNPQTTPPLAAKTEEKVRGNVFKVRLTAFYGIYSAVQKIGQMC